jgi:Holliday junction resolvase RusA-like endonuclease
MRALFYRDWPPTVDAETFPSRRPGRTSNKAKISAPHTRGRQEYKQNVTKRGREHPLGSAVDCPLKFLPIDVKVTGRASKKSAK